MTSDSADGALRQVAEAVRKACVQTALAAYEQAGMDGLCQEGRWETAIDAMRSLNIEALVHDLRRVSAGRMG